MVYGAIAQRSTISTIPKSMISNEIESYGELVMVERLKEARGRRSWLALVRVGGRRTMFSSIVMKDDMSWVPLAVDLQPLSGQLVILAFGAHGLAV